MKRVLFAAVILGSLVIGLNTGFVHWDPAVATTVPPCQFLGINDSGTTINTTIVCVTPIASGGGVTTVKATATACGAAVQPSATTGAAVVSVPICPSPYPTPTATATATACGQAVSASGLAISVPVCTPVPQNTASPTATSTSTAGAPSLVVSGSFPYTLTANFPGAGGGITLTSPIPTNNPTTQAGGIQITGPIAIGPAPSPVSSYVPNAIDISSGNSSVIYTRIGTSSSSIIGVAEGLLGVSLSPLVGGQTMLAIDQNGNLAADNSVAAPNIYATDTISSFCGSSLLSSALFDCTGGSDQGEVVLGGPGSAGVAYCQLDWNRAVAGYLSFPSCPVDLAASTNNNGEITCGLSGTASCSGTATVRSGAKCTASYEENDTTITPLTDLLPLQVHTASTTLTVYMDTSASLTGTLAANYWCP